jgi:aldose 1-epimerase
MIPFSNRVENGRIGTASVRVVPNVAGSPHAQHGHGWQAGWDVTAADRRSCTLSYRRAPTPDWPWAYRGQQTIAISADSLRFTLSIENEGAEALPCGLGFHPYFARSAGTRLELAAECVWDGAAASFPTRRVAVPASLDFRGGPRLSERHGVDHCYEGLAHRATVRDEDPRRSYVIEGCKRTRFAIVYVPAGADHFCVEPVTHAVNAMNLADPAAAGWWTLEPGASRSIEMTIRDETKP